jgi:hypothetical protein
MLENARIEMRIHGTAPLFKLYVLNNEEAFFGSVRSGNMSCRSKGTRTWGAGVVAILVP